MSGASALSDAAARREALSPGRSFLVQAPAGSGKTELLIQRFLRLLAVVDEPEQILAVTFTRKAAAEMQARILQALDRARTGERPAEAHLLAGYELASQAIARDAERGWRLAEQPGRLRIGTIDSVNSWLAGRAPLRSGLAALHGVAEDARPLYQEAARETLSLAAEGEPLGPAVGHLLQHCDNRAETCVGLLADMLARRDQWLRYTGAGAGGIRAELRAALEQGLELLVAGVLHEAAGRLPADCRDELLVLLEFAAGQLATRKPAAAVVSWRHASSFPAAVCSELVRWRGLAEALLTRNGQWRSPRGLTVRDGFPADEPEMKRRMAGMLERLAGEAHLEAALARLLSLPEPRYSDGQWRLLESLLSVLPAAAALLEQVFAARRLTDFTAVARQALVSLGPEDAPSELALALDYRVEHILLDEYQDTSRSQYDLLLRLTAGWQPGDGRTLFLVGDPMQSIYRFREADVSVYLQTQARGIGAIQPEFLQLRTNFRSDPAIVEWVNRVFAALMPEAVDALTGAVPYAASTAFRPPSPGAAVRWHAAAHGDAEAEAAQVVETLLACRRERPADTIGVLVRSRRHAALLGPLLRRAGVGYAAPDLESLADEPAALDILALARALCHRADRLAWLAVLRAPWCGLTLHDLHALAAHDHDTDVYSLLGHAEQCVDLSADGLARVSRVREILGRWLQRRGALPMADLVEGAWIEVGGPATLGSADDLEVVDACLRVLAEFDEGGDCADVLDLERELGQRTLSRGAQDARIQIMTIHKAKGLEFDTVLLPGLGYGTRPDQKPLLVWSELIGMAEPPPLVLAPRSLVAEDGDPLFDLLWGMEGRRRDFESQRLLYVAATRARHSLHLFAALATDAATGEAVPAGKSLLAWLWPHCRHELNLGPGAGSGGRPDGGGPDWFEVPLRRLSSSWAPPAAPGKRGAIGPPDRRAAEPPEYDWATRWARHAGSVVHRWLQEIATAGLESWDAARIESLAPVFQRQLRRLGTPEADLARAGTRVAAALQACLADPRGRWLLSPEHADARAELAVGVSLDGRFGLCRIDRTFVDEQGTRWVIDFKSSTHEGGGLDAFLDSEVERYRPQLRAYRDALAGLESRPVRTALYFPLLQAFREVVL